MKLISTEELKLVLDKEECNDNTLLELIIGYVSSRFETYLSRNLKQEERTKYFNAGKSLFYLPAYPIVNSGLVIPEVYLNDTLYSVDSYYVWEEKGLIEFNSVIGRSKPKEIKIIWTGGYLETSGVLAVPDDLKMACALQSTLIFRRRSDIGLSGTKVGAGNISINTPIKFLPEVESILKLYRALPSQE